MSKNIENDKRFGSFEKKLDNLEVGIKIYRIDDMKSRIRLLKSKNSFNVEFCYNNFETANENKASACSIGVFQFNKTKINKKFESLIRPPKDMDNKKRLLPNAWNLKKILYQK